MVIVLNLAGELQRMGTETSRNTDSLFYSYKYLQVHRFFDKYATLENINHAYCNGLNRNQVQSKITNRFIAISRIQYKIRG